MSFLTPASYSLHTVHSTEDTPLGRGRLPETSEVVTAVAVLSLAIGIGANTAIFSLVNAIILSPFLADRPPRW